ncbi:MAG: DotU family type IV/VI secretion system protein [Deltaproteobacteria bacterium]|nr:DotU family type IV/VI secretion system protein [Deltaproteobacteria bacterium]
MRLIDCFIEIIAYTADFLKTAVEENPDASAVEQDYAILFKRSEDKMKEGKFECEAWDSARFALCAWIDEMVMCSSWEGQSAWVHRQLQRMYYGSTNAGEEFFERLEELAPEAKDIREVYAYCLALGFKGRYFRKEDEPYLYNIQKKNLSCVRDDELLGTEGDGAKTLFPGAYKTLQEGGGAAPRRPGIFTAFTVTFLICPPVLFAILFFIYNEMLRRIVSDFFG